LKLINKNYSISVVL